MSLSLLGIGLFILTMGFSLWATMRVKSTYLKYNQVPARSGYNGAQAAARILDAAGIHDVEIVEQNGMLSDHYDPMNKRLVLSSENYQGTSCAALGVAAHECGHAIQHKIAYVPLQWRVAAVGVATYANQAVMWLPIIGLFTGLLHPANITLYLTIMAVAWGIIMLFNLVTLPVEFDASRRAKIVLGKMSFIEQGDEANAVKKVLDAAAWTYVAAFLTSLLYFLWYLLPLLMGRRND
jgi:Zn-dependent membrane protease YugP